MEHHFSSFYTSMTTKRHLALAAGFALFLLAACGSNDGVKLGEFPALSKTEGDEPFKLTAPSSKSPAAFTYSSSDLKVATIEGDTVTVHVAGTTTITARQGEIGSYNPTSTSALLTVKERTCTAPAVRENGLCVPPSTTAAVVVRNGLNWMPAAFKLNWAEADAFCKNITYQGKTGWALPDRAELKDLATSGALSGQGWAMGDAWSATIETDKIHTAVALATGDASSLMNDNKVYVACVLSQ